MMDLTPLMLAVMAGIILAAQTVETVTGFGATVIALAAGAHLVPIPTLVVALVLIGIPQSMWLAARGARKIAWRSLLVPILPACAAGLIAGRLFSTYAGGVPLKMLLGGFVVAVASFELSMLLRSPRRASSLPAPAGVALLAGGGFFHGIFASGGPLIVLYASRAFGDKGVFRATLSLLWLALNVTLLATYAARGEVHGDSLRLAVWMLPPLLAGIALGEVLHRRMNEDLFRTIVQSLLLATGISLLFPGKG